MNRFGIFSRCWILLALAMPACAVQTGTEDDEQTLESDVSSNAPSDEGQSSEEASTKRPFAVDNTFRQFESFVPNQGQTEGPNPQPWSDTPGRGNGRNSGGSSK